MTKQDKAEFTTYCRSCTDSQLREVHTKETLARRSAYAAIAKQEMIARGIA